MSGHTSTSGSHSLAAAGGGCHHEGFVGYPRAMVVHSEIRSEGGFAGTIHEYVAYVIRVMDGDGEWSVTRRYRNFETLHMRLQAHSREYRELKAALPMKRLFGLNQDTEFVHQRRKELDLFIIKILRCAGGGQDILPLAFSLFL